MFDDGITVAGGSGVYSERVRLDAVGGLVKRIFDAAFSLIALISLLPLFIAIIVVIRLSSKGRAFFVHPRIGLNGQMFPCLKFRTMVIDADDQLSRILETDPDAQVEFELYQKLKGDPRIVPGIGTFLRTTSLDELPQLINVLLGQMSIVGPRPVTKEELPKYGKAVGEYLRVRPGITGLWQVSGRNNLSFDERVMIDQTYIRGWSLAKDLGIILRTVDVMFMRRGAY